MFYHWLAPLGQTHIIFNLFNYISFRAAGATVTALLLAFLVGPPVIGRLRARKVGQIIRAEGPASHQSKRGTPTMGGLIILVCSITSVVRFAVASEGNCIITMTKPWSSSGRKDEGSWRKAQPRPASSAR